MRVQVCVTSPKQDLRLNPVKLGSLGNTKMGWQEFLIQHTGLVKEQMMEHVNLVLEVAEAWNAELPACVPAIHCLTAMLAEEREQELSVMKKSK